ncbi:MAG TPA: Gfo/Idh/MocA family oxidoreductase [Candidatus Limnocylindria bacterium]|nr:Gfo/Idh/MocA family oxidoreductase [Candidatus Limnocylindria bacterium]
MAGPRRLRLGLVGCGDVAHRWYLPALADLADRVELVACCDPRLAAAEAVATAVRPWSPGATVHTDLDAFLADSDLDAVINLSPAPAHASVTQPCLEAGLHVYSEKPLAGTLAEADRLIATAGERGVRLLCAPGVAVTNRFRWLAEIVASGRFGSLSLAVAHHADPGPAAWREYTGDPSVFYREGVGPLIDHGIYRLHGLTMLMGPVRRVQAMGAISNAARIVRAGPLTGQTILVTTPDHVLVNLEFASGALGQLLASFGTAATLAPWLELHFARATISFSGPSWDKDAPASIYLDDDGPLGLEGWTHGISLPPPGEPLPVVAAGIAHFISCLRGDEEPVLTAEHARHVLDIIVQTYASIADGASHATATTF